MLNSTGTISLFSTANVATWESQNYSCPLISTVKDVSPDSGAIAQSQAVMIKDFCLREKKPKSILVPQELLSDEEINSVVENGFDEVNSACEVS